MTAGLRVGSMFTGVGALDMAARALTGGTLAWVADPYMPARRVLAYQYPEVRNLGDVAAVRWTDVKPVDLLCTGFPCQDVSLAGQRAGLHPDQSGQLFESPSMWWQTCRAIDELEPAAVLIENVGGLLSAPADAVGQPGRGSAFGAVLTDLADRGFDAEWTVAEAAAVGAPHRRRRVFIAAAHRSRLGRGARTDGLRAGDPAEERHGRPVALGGRRDAPAPHPGGGGLRDVLADRLARPRHGPALARDDGPPRPDALLGGSGPPDPWGPYGAAVRRWERILGRPAPAPAVLGSHGGRVLSPAFVEWMMGLPAGHVTDVPGIVRRDALRLLGNGVVPQQAEAAFSHLLPLLLADDHEVAA